MSLLRPLTLSVERDHSQPASVPRLALVLTTDFGLQLKWEPFSTSGAYLRVHPLTVCCGALGFTRPAPGVLTPAGPTLAVYCTRCRTRTNLPVELFQLERSSFELAQWRMNGVQRAHLASLVDVFLDPVESMIYASALEDRLIEIMEGVEVEAKQALRDTRAHLDLRRQEAILHELAEGAAP